VAQLELEGLALSLGPAPALLSTPQFQLGGVVASDGAVAPALTPSDASSAACCERLKLAWLASGTAHELLCSP
jgi:hypothetical protein